nr:MAG TPA: hypothetical protein [Caudoviricetes sp.]
MRTNIKIFGKLSYMLTTIQSYNAQSEQFMNSYGDVLSRIMKVLEDGKKKLFRKMLKGYMDWYKDAEYVEHPIWNLLCILSEYLRAKWLTDDLAIRLTEAITENLQDYCNTQILLLDSLNIWLAWEYIGDELRNRLDGNLQEAHTKFFSNRLEGHLTSILGRKALQIIKRRLGGGYKYPIDTTENTYVMRNLCDSIAYLHESRFCPGIMWHLRWAMDLNRLMWIDQILEDLFSGESGVTDSSPFYIYTMAMPWIERG